MNPRMDGKKMIATSLLNAPVCFRFPPAHKGDGEHLLHKTLGVIKNVYLHSNVPKYTVMNKKGGLETCVNSQMIICLDVGFAAAVKMIEEEDAQR